MINLKNRILYNYHKKTIVVTIIYFQNLLKIAYINLLSKKILLKIYILKLKKNNKTIKNNKVKLY